MLICGNNSCPLPKITLVSGAHFCFFCEEDTKQKKPNKTQTNFNINLTDSPADSPHTLFQETYNAPIQKVAFSCHYNECNTSFSSAILLKNHINTAHENIEPNIYNEDNKPHRVNNNKKAVECPHCGAKFTAQSSLNSHVLTTHTNEKDYKCDICAQKGVNSFFSIKVKLVLHHKRVHEVHEEKNFTIGGSSS